MDQTETIARKIRDFLERHPEETPRALSMRATGKPDLVRTILSKGTTPNSLNLQRLADAMGVSLDDLIGRAPARPAPGASEVALADTARPFRAAGGNDLPIHGTAQGQDISFDGNGGARIEQTMLDPSETIRYIRRPEALLGVDKAYAVYIQGDSMAPRWEPGDLAVVDPRREPNIGDDVIVQLTGDPDEFGDSRVVSVLIKRLMRRSASFVDLLQYQPECTFRVDKNRIAAMHRIVRMGDLLGA